MNVSKRSVVDIVITDQDAAPLFNLAFEVGQKNPGPVVIPFRSEGEEFRTKLQALVNRAVNLAIEEITKP